MWRKKFSKPLDKAMKRSIISIVDRKTGCEHH